MDRFAGASIKPVNDILCKRWFPVRIQQNRVVTDDRLAAIALDDIGLHGEPAPSGHVETRFGVAHWRPHDDRSNPVAAVFFRRPQIYDSRSGLTASHPKNDLTFAQPGFERFQHGVTLIPDDLRFLRRLR